MRIMLLILSGMICFAGLASASSATAPSCAQTATNFLRELEKGDVDAAMKQWDSRSLNDRVKERIKKMSEKIIKSGGIKTLETPAVEPRPKNLTAHETMLGVVYVKG